jgi:hypothetical protein
METPLHPGTIVYAKVVDGQEIVVSERPVAEVPEAMRFHQTPQGPVPVVKAVAMLGPGDRIIEIHEYGPGGVLLRSTLAAPPASR